MAASIWWFTDTGRQKFLDGAFDLDTDTFKLALLLSTSNIGFGSTTYAGLTNEHANANGYTTGGQTVTLTVSGTTTVTIGLSSSVVWTASGGSIAARFAVLYENAGSVVAFCLLDDTPADVTVTNGGTLTIAAHASGLFTISSTLQYPIAPMPVDINPAATVRTVGTFTTAAELSDYLTGVTHGGPQWGDLVSLTAGNTFQGNFVLPQPTGSQGGQNYVTFQSSAIGTLPAAGSRVAPSDAVNMPTLIAPSGGGANYAISTTTNAVHHYRFVGIRFTSPQSVGVAAIVDTLAPDETVATNQLHHISFERCLVQPDYDYGVIYAITLHGAHMRIVDSYLTDCMINSNADAKCVWIDYGATGPILIDNCRLEGMGENIGVGFNAYAGPVVNAGYEWQVPQDVTIRRCYIRRKLSYLKAHATYQPACDQAGAGTIASESGNDVTFSEAHGLSLGTYGPFIKDLTLGEYREVTVIVNPTTVTLASAFSSDPAGHSWRYNAVDIAGKNLLEFKGVVRALVEECIFENGWNDGQNTWLTMTPRAGGYVSDVRFRYCRMIECVATALSCGDVQGGGTGEGFATPYPTKRICFQHCLFKNTCSPTAVTLGTVPHNFFVTTSTQDYGQVQQGATTITAGATTGLNITFTASAAVWDSRIVGATLAYESGRATIITFTNSTSVQADITADFPDTSAHVSTLWSCAKGALVQSDTYMTMEDLILEHLTMAGTDTGYTFPIRLYASALPAAVVTRSALRNNVMVGTDNAGNGAGIGSYEGGPRGTAGLNAMVNRTQGEFLKNVMFGPQMTSGTNFSADYTGDDDGGAGSTFNTACHDPDETGSTGGGTVGFADYSGEDYTLTASGPYINWGSDGATPGCDIVTLNTQLTGVDS